MKAIIWIIILAIVVWGIWWFAHRNSTAGIPATGDTSGQVNGASDSYLNASSTDASSTDQGSYDGKG